MKIPHHDYEDIFMRLLLDFRPKIPYIHAMKITRRSPFSGKTHSMDLDITQEQNDRWNGGDLIQNVFLDLTADEREFLMTGLTKEDWGSMFTGDVA